MRKKKKGKGTEGNNVVPTEKKENTKDVVF